MLIRTINIVRRFSRKSNLIDTVYGRLYVPILCWYSGLKDNNFTEGVPPAKLRYKVHGNAGISGFLETGKRISADIEIALTANGFELNTSRRVLDFGCGCGRTLMWYNGNRAEFYGTDIDEDAISWCVEHLKFARFSLNDALPPLRFEDGFFDIIYAISIFTHLDLNRRSLWLKELRRILKPTGILLASIHGKQSWKGLSERDIREVLEKGFIFRTSQRNRVLFPEWYQLSHETEDHAKKSFGRIFQVADYIEKGIDGNHDLILLKK